MHCIRSLTVAANGNINSRVDRKKNTYKTYNKYNETTIMRSDSGRAQRAWEKEDWDGMCGNSEGARNRVIEGWSRGGEESCVSRLDCGFE